MAFSICCFFARICQSQAPLLFFSPPPRWCVDLLSSFLCAFPSQIRTRTPPPFFSSRVGALFIVQKQQKPPLSPSSFELEGASSLFFLFPCPRMVEGEKNVIAPRCFPFPMEYFPLLSKRASTLFFFFSSGDRGRFFFPPGLCQGGNLDFSPLPEGSGTLSFCTV